MEKKCEYCNIIIQGNNNYCPKCGKLMKKKKPILLMLLAPIVILMIIIIVIIVLFTTKDRSTANQYYKDYIIPDIKNKYGDKKNNGKFIKKEACTMYRGTGIAGDTSKVKKKYKGCYIYFYDVEIGELKTKYYYLVSNEGNSVYDEIAYTKLGEDLLQQKDSLGDFKLDYLYYESTDSNYPDKKIDWSLKNKNIVLYYDDSIENVVNKAFLKNYARIVDEMKEKYGFNQISILLVFSNNKILDYHNGNYERMYCYSGGGIEGRNKQFIVDNVITGKKIDNNTCTTDGITIYNNNDLTDNMIKWCLANNKSSYDYHDYEIVEKVETILQKYTNIEYVVYDVISTDEPRIMIYSNNFGELNSIFDDLRANSFLQEEDGHNWRIAITDDYDFYNKINSNDTYKSLIELNNVIYNSKKISIADGYNYQIYNEYLENGKDNKSTYYLIYTQREYDCERTNSCTILYEANDF